MSSVEPSDVVVPEVPAGAAPLPPGAGLTREVLLLAGPAVASGFVALGYHWIGQMWIGRLAGGDPTPVAAASVATFCVWAFYALSMLVGVGLGALVGRYAGARRDDATRYVALQGVRWALVLGAFVACVGFFAAPAMVARTGVTSAAMDLASTYVRIVYVGGFGILVQGACDATFRGRGDTKTSFLVTAGALLASAGLDPILMFGLGPIPRLGVPGAALSQVIAQTAGALVSLAILRRRGWIGSARPADDVLRLAPDTILARGPLPGLDLSVARRMLRVGLPSALSGLFFVEVYTRLSAIVTRAGGDAAQAGLGVGLRGEQVAFIVGSGCAAAASSLVARRLGAGRPDAAAAAAWRATWIGAASCLVWSVFLAFPDTLIGLFFDEGSVDAAAHARAYFGIVALCLVPQCFEVVLEGAFGGAGMTVPPMIVSMAMTALRIPFASLAAFEWGLGVSGIWMVIAATAALRGIVIAAWFSLGTWKRRTV